LEDEDDDSQRKEINVAIMPPVNSCQDLTDEEPDDEENATFENLPVSQLRAEDVWEDDDDIPLGLLQVATSKKYNWMDSDSRSKVSSLQFFFYDAVFEMFVTFSNQYASHKNKVGNIHKEVMKFFRIL
jgi:hypothetical protein